jgi:tetratricopeptide (TPR) repeat protein
MPDDFRDGDDGGGAGHDSDMIDFDDTTQEETAAAGGVSRTALGDEMDDFLSDDSSPGLDELGGGAGGSPIELNEAADASFAKGNYESALTLYRKIISTNRTAAPEEKKLYEKAHFDAGRCLMEMGRHKEALDLFSIILRSMTGSPYVKNTIFHIGMIFEAVGQKEKAITYYNKVLNMSPKDKINSDALTKIKQLQGR